MLYFSFLVGYKTIYTNPSPHPYYHPTTMVCTLYPIFINTEHPVTLVRRDPSLPRLNFSAVVPKRGARGIHIARYLAAKVEGLNPDLLRIVEVYVLIR